jgi:hypothetical protein
MSRLLGPKGRERMFRELTRITNETIKLAPRIMWVGIAPPEMWLPAPPRCYRYWWKP